MQVQEEPEILDDVSYIGLTETDEHLKLYTCMQNAVEFRKSVLQKLKRSKRTNHANEIKKSKMRAYLMYKVPEIVRCLNLTLVTNVLEDHLLTVRRDDAWFVYFGAMTAEFIHVACWLRVPRKNDGNINENDGIHPKTFFWVLHTSYAQELEALGEANEGIDVDTVKKHLDLTDGIEST